MSKYTKENQKNISDRNSNVINLNDYERNDSVCNHSELGVVLSFSDFVNTDFLCPDCRSVLDLDICKKVRTPNETSQYVVCSKCGFVSKYNPSSNGGIKPTNTLKEWSLAYKAFKEDGNAPSHYKFYKNDDTCKFSDLFKEWCINRAFML